jgi:hypothetical protein
MVSAIQSTVFPDMRACFAARRLLLQWHLSLLVAGRSPDRLVCALVCPGGGGCILMAVVALFIPAIMQIEENRRNLQVEAQPG